MVTEWLLWIVIFSILHLVLAIMLLHDLAYRRHVLGGHKAPWALGIMFLTFVGSILYLLCHPKIFYDRERG